MAASLRVRPSVGGNRETIALLYTWGRKRGLSPTEGGAGNMMCGSANGSERFLPGVGVLRSR
jgi:hypothetical protein